MASFICLSMLVCLFHLISSYQYGGVIRSDRDICNGEKCGLNRPICAIPFKRMGSLSLSCLSPAEIFDNSSTVNYVFRYSGEGEIYFSSKSIDHLFILQEEDRFWRMSHSWSKSLHLIVIPINEETRGHLFLLANQEENTFRLIRIDSSSIPTSSPSSSAASTTVDISTSVTSPSAASTTVDISTTSRESTTSPSSPSTTSTTVDISTTSRESPSSSTSSATVDISTTVMTSLPYSTGSSRRSSISPSTIIPPMNNPSKRLYYLFCLLLLLIGIPIFIYFYKKRYVTVSHTPFADIEMNIIE